jgi:hypothetical protein
MGLLAMDLDEIPDPEERCDLEDKLNLGNTASPLMVNKDRFRKVFRFIV